MSDLPRYVLGLDPGLQTGWALYDVKEDTFTCGEWNWATAAAGIEELAAAHGTELAVVCERFIITLQTAKDSQAPWSLMLIGVAQYMSQKYACADYQLQAVAAAKMFSTDWRLKALEWYQPGLPHARDAARHTLLYLVARKWWRDCLVGEDTT